MAKMKACPVCGQNVGIDKLQAHVKKVHPRDEVALKFDDEDRRQLKKSRESYKPSVRPRGKWMILVVLILVIIIVLAVVLVPRGLKVGDIPPSLDLKDEFNNPWNLDDHKDQGRCILLEFFHPECPYCGQLTNETLVPLYNNHAFELEMVSIAVAWEHQGWENPPDYGDVAAFRTNHPGADWTFLADQGTSAKDLYGAGYWDGLPMCYLIGKDWKIAYIHSGTIDYSEMQAAIAPFL